MGTRREAIASGAERLRKAGLDNPWFEAQLLLAHSLNVDIITVITHGDQELSCSEAQGYGEMVAQRALRKPMAYIVGSKSFMHWEFIVNEDVLVPRPESELLVERAIYELVCSFPSAPLRLADIGTGSGAMGLSMVALLPRARLAAVDLSPSALQVAEQNASRLGVEDRVTFFCGDLLQPLEGWRSQGFHCIVANLPYIATGELSALQPEVSRHEPRNALVSGKDGLMHYQRLLRQVINYLVPGGMVFIEIGNTQAASARELFLAGGFPHPRVEKDLGGHDRVVWARK